MSEKKPVKAQSDSSESHAKNQSPAPAKNKIGALQALATEVAQLKHLIQQRQESTPIQQKAFDQLYEELRQYKDDFIFQMEKPLLLDLLLLYDSVNWFQQSLIKKEMSPEVIADSFQYLIDELLELLYRRDVLPMESRPRFDRENQRVIKTIATSTETEDYIVHQILKRGFMRGGRILRPEEVILKRYAGKTDGSGN